MPLAITLQKPSFPAGVLKPWPEGCAPTMKPLGIAVSSLLISMADLKRDTGQAVADLFVGRRASLPALAR